MYIYIYAFFESYISAEVSSGSTCKWSGLVFVFQEKKNAGNEKK